MKRGAILLLVLAGTTLPSVAVKRVSIAQLEQMLAASHGKPDHDLAWEIGDLQLTERVNPARLENLRKSAPGDQSRQALTAIADASEFQAPPAAELPATATPDLATQRRIMGLAAEYVTKAIPQLPNFMATRATTRFEDTPQLQRAEGFFVPYEPLHLVGTSSATVLYRDGREVEDMAAAHKKRAGTPGLTTWGEFGPVLATVLLDAAQSQLAWSHWEQGAGGLEAVFSYEVPREKSHYEVNYCCVAQQAGSDVADLYPFRQVAGYRGEMAVDPVTGTILRLTVQAALKPGSPMTRADMVVDYGPVEIGGKTYICPVKSVSITTAEMVQLTQQYLDPVARQLQPLKTMLNETRFEQYHVFRAEARVLTSENKAEEGAASGAEAPVSSGGLDVRAEARTLQTPGLDVRAEAPVNLGGVDVRAEARTFQDGAPAASFPAEAGTQQSLAGARADASVAPKATDSTVAAVQPSRAEAVPDAAVPEISDAETAGVPDAPAHPLPAESSSGFTLRTTSRLVDVGLVAYDKKGRPVTDLKQSDFAIYDNGRKQEIKYFGQAGEGAVPSPQSVQAPGAASEPVYSNRQITAPLQPRTAAAESHATILLIDASNLAWGDLSYARQEMLRFLKTLPAGDLVGLYILRSHGFEVLQEPSGDHALVADKLSRWMPSAQDLLQAQEEEFRNRQQMEYVMHNTDLLSVNGNTPTGYEDSLFPVDPQLRSEGSRPVATALFLLLGVARHLAVLPEHKSLIWVSSDNVLADFSEKAPHAERGDKYTDALAMHAWEALNEAHISIYPLDASQLEAGGVSAGLANANVRVSPGASPVQSLQGVNVNTKEAEEAEAKSRRDINPGRVMATLQQDTHPIQETFVQLAQATGGRTLRRAGDIAAELNGIAEDGRAAYLMSFTPDSPADGKYHLLTVKLTGRRDLTLRYRSGYLYDKEPATLKERFQRAVWQARDVNEIGITAVPARSGGGSVTLKLNIAATDLEMAQAPDAAQDAAQQEQRWTDKLDIFLVERDDAALHAKVSGRMLGLRLRPSTYQKALREGIPVERLLPARKSGGSIRVLVVDENSGRMGSVTIPATAMGPAS